MPKTNKMTNIQLTYHYHEGFELNIYVMDFYRIMFFTAIDIINTWIL